MVINRGFSALLTTLFVALLFFGCSSDETDRTSDISVNTPPEWSVNANIYEVNIRQFSPEGTFEAFSEEIPRLKEMGIEILWLMPIHPIGEENRKGTLGSYYSIVDYTEVNPEFGTKEDFQNLVDTAHENDMKVIIDWVANHTAWDAVWTETNPEYYVTNEDGEFYTPEEDWEDVIQLDVDNKDMWDAMISAMEYWVRDYNIDGFRADVAYMLPTEFWIEARQRLDEIKPVFMLAEAEEPELHQAFDMSYAWNYASTIRDIGAGEAGLDALDAVLSENFDRFDKSDYRMFFTTNHDENSWTGSDPDMYGDNFENFAVLSATVWGMPLVYNGQESGLDKQLEFFEKDQIDWNDYKYEDFYRTLLHLNRDNPALFNGNAGGDYLKVSTNSDDSIFAYKRIAGDDQVFVILNFSDSIQNFTFDSGDQGEWTDVFDGTDVSVPAEMELDANSYMLLAK
ncbi:alpha-amylase family glycosyl hydrolase [Rhodohalobacter barkolensis]|uniref:Alpha-amylase n=1 Tax=Rhodohalobacter barkolensis TaxID=2053187 RepID=A0A2N0VKR6_9BACT|nr:alpha-amylase family glycosyl hydrolase [Rhodohalobacter barkolensis]PKD44772.1 alpha-amylase [Rhodohalobacter barkolensis]